VFLFYFSPKYGLVQPLVGFSNVPETSHGNGHSSPEIYSLVIEQEIGTLLLTPQ
jgi:hypothetical protein